MIVSRPIQAGDAESIARPRRIGRRALIASAATAVITDWQGAAAALPDEARILVGTNLGSQYDRHARILARHLPRLRSGLRVQVEAIPRAGGKLAAKLVHESAGDGRTLAMLPSGLIFAEILGEEGVAYALRDLRWIGSFDAELRLLVLSRRLHIDSLEAMRQAPSPILLGAVSTASASWYEPLIVNRILGTRLKPVPGYSSAARSAALIAGEIGAAIGSHDTFIELLAQQHVTALLRFNDLPLPGVSPPPPTLASIVDARAYPAVMKLLDSHLRLGRALCLSPRTPPATTASWRAAFDAVTHDETYRREVAASGLALAPLSGAAVEQLIATVFDSPGEIRDALHAALGCGMKIADHGRQSC